MAIWLRFPKSAPSAPAPLSAFWAKTPVSSAPARPPTPWTPKGSGDGEDPKRLLSSTAAWQMNPAMQAIAIASSTWPAAAVIASRPATRPVTTPRPVPYPIAPAIQPIAIAADGATYPAAGVVATSPDTTPDATPIAVGLPRCDHSTTIHPTPPPAAPSCVVTNDSPRTLPFASADPALSAIQPNHR